MNGSGTSDDRTVPWPLWRKIVAYVLLCVLALVSIWIVDRKVHRPAAEPASTLTSR
jgi:hypothetical protein